MPDTTRIATNLRTLRILEIMGEADHPMTPTQINAGLGLPKQTIHRLCKTLVEEGYLMYDTGSKGLRPARRLRKLASGVLYTSRFHIARHQVLQDVANTVAETVNFVVPQDGGMRYLDRVETDWPFRIQLPIGTNVPFHCTASGKTFLASLPPKARRVMIDSIPLNRLTDNTITDPDKLMDELKRIRKQGFAVDNEEFFDGMIALAVPVTDPDGRYVGALAFHGPTQRMTIESAMAQRNVVLEGAKKLQSVLLT